MTPTWLPTDEQMRRLRQDGEFVCTCPRSYPILLNLWDVWECDRCGKKVMSDGDQR